ncbi:MAG TPA: iron-containing alcohol dehydrogenase [Methanothermococcus okinawensis]|uniref:Iron-containing alcohol dehydrogenase n=2 Tax=Methanothermococcus okinawensis TaxID=155863 RepID=A0A832ZCG3_9EURY|nr:iron-containing alcohol dehydrogenase [Methanococcaceae archaeon]HIP84881.1 iron-containing alcohol dehydrogenase [Methanothermococcus okinawensis]
MYKILSKLRLENPLVVVGRRTKKYAPDFDYVYYHEIELEEENIKKTTRGYDSIIGVGGGRSIDIAKYMAYCSGIPSISMPTTASNDGIASPVVSLEQPSRMVEPPIAVVVDLDIIRRSPRRLLSAGFGDVISNITAVLDWKLAHREIGESYSESSAIFSKTIGEELMDYVLKDIDLSQYPEKLVKALIGSGITISIAGSTRPASGSEHLFSHALDYLKRKYKLDVDSLHGEQCGVGTLISSYLHYKEGNLNYEYVENIRSSLKRVRAPTTGKELGFEEEIIIEALTIAHKIRRRYTVLRNGISRDKAEEILKECGVI